MFAHFENYLEGKEADPVRYSAVDTDKQFISRFRLSDVHTDMVILASIHSRMKQNKDEQLAYRGYLRVGSDVIADQIVLLGENDRQLAESVLVRGETLDEKELGKLALTSEMVEAHRKGQDKIFRNLRQRFLKTKVCEWLSDNLIDIQPVI